MKIDRRIAAVLGDLRRPWPGRRATRCSNSVTAGLRARLKSCWSIVSKSQPSPATIRTNQWYRVKPLYQGLVSGVVRGAGRGRGVEVHRVILRDGECQAVGMPQGPSPRRGRAWTCEDEPARRSDHPGVLPATFWPRISGLPPLVRDLDGRSGPVP